MSEIIHVSRFIKPFEASIRNLSDTSKLMESRLFIDIDNNNNLSTPADQFMIIKPRRVSKGALKAFKNTLHEIVPELRNLTHEDIEKLIDERNADLLDSM